MQLFTPFTIKTGIEAAIQEIAFSFNNDLAFGILL
jgi:hypothetical protein